MMQKFTAMIIIISYMGISYVMKELMEDHKRSCGDAAHWNSAYVIPNSLSRSLWSTVFLVHCSTIRVLLHVCVCVCVHVRVCACMRACMDCGIKMATDNHMKFTICNNDIHTKSVRIHFVNLIGVSLSKPHTSGTLCDWPHMVCMVSKHNKNEYLTSTVLLWS